MINFFIYLIVVELTNWSYFRFIKMFIVGLTTSLAIDRTILMEINVTVNFSELSL